MLANSAVVLMEKGTRVLGEYRSGMRQGQHRLFVLWTRAVTPAGVAVGLASPAADPLGRAGFDGALDTHFWDRFCRPQGEGGVGKWQHLPRLSLLIHGSPDRLSRRTTARRNGRAPRPQNRSHPLPLKALRAASDE